MLFPSLGAMLTLKKKKKTPILMPSDIIIKQDTLDTTDTQTQKQNMEWL